MKIVEVLIGLWLVLMILSFFPIVVGILLGLSFGTAIVFGTYFFIRAILG